MPLIPLLANSEFEVSPPNSAKSPISLTPEVDSHAMNFA